MSQVTLRVDNLRNVLIVLISIKLNLRLKTGVAGSTFTCDQCNKSFTRKQTLQTHAIKYHKAQASVSTASPSPYFPPPHQQPVRDNSLPEMFDGNIDLRDLLSPEELERIVPSPPDDDLSRLHYI